MQNIAVILAGGRGTRMQLKTPKALLKICNKPLITYLLEALNSAGISRTFVVLGDNAQDVAPHLPKNINIVHQPKPLGTGHALQCAAKEFSNIDAKVLLLNGDGPIVSQATLSSILNMNDEKMRIFTGKMQKNSPFGRILRKSNSIYKIIEAKDCTPQQLAITEQNLGIYCFDNQTLQTHINNLKPQNAQKEYYVTDLVELFYNAGHKISAHVLSNSELYIPGMNTLPELVKSNALMQAHINLTHIQNGVYILNSQTTFIDAYTTIWQNTTIAQNTTIENSCIGENVFIGPNCIIINSKLHSGITIGAGSTIINQSIQSSRPPKTTLI